MLDKTQHRFVQRHNYDHVITNIKTSIMLILKQHIRKFTKVQQILDTASAHIAHFSMRKKTFALVRTLGIRSPTSACLEARKAGVPEVSPRQAVYGPGLAVTCSTVWALL